MLRDFLHDFSITAILAIFLFGLVEAFINWSPV